VQIVPKPRENGARRTRLGGSPYIPVLAEAGDAIFRQILNLVPWPAARGI
jgi:hypothetical protein